MTFLKFQKKNLDRVSPVAFDSLHLGGPHSRAVTLMGMMNVTSGRIDVAMLSSHAIAANSLLRILPVGLTGIAGTTTMRDGRL